MITYDERNKTINVPDGTSLNELAWFLNKHSHLEDFKVMIYGGSDTQTNLGYRAGIPNGTG